MGTQIYKYTETAELHKQNTHTHTHKMR